jgi:hypothetical protein
MTSVANKNMPLHPKELAINTGSDRKPISNRQKLNLDCIPKSRAFDCISKWTAFNFIVSKDGFTNSSSMRHRM